MKPLALHAARSLEDSLAVDVPVSSKTRSKSSGVAKKAKVAVTRNLAGLESTLDNWLVRRAKRSEARSGVQRGQAQTAGDEKTTGSNARSDWRKTTGEKRAAQNALLSLRYWFTSMAPFVHVCVWAALTALLKATH